MPLARRRARARSMLVIHEADGDLSGVGRSSHRSHHAVHGCGNDSSSHEPRQRGLNIGCTENKNVQALESRECRR